VKVYPLRLALGLLSILFGFAVMPSASALTVPTLLAVPEHFAYPRYSELSQHRAQLKTRFGTLKRKISAFSARCASVDKGSSAASACRIKQRGLTIKIGAYSKDAKHFNDRVRAASGLSCQKGGFETRRGRKSGKEYVNCKCRFGFATTGKQCTRKLTALILQNLPAFITREKNGDVRVDLIDLDDASLSVNIGFQGNAITTGVNSYLKINTLTGEELSVGMNTSLNVSTTKGDLMIANLKGNVRFKTNTKDSVFNGLQKKARRYFGMTKAWVKKTHSRRFRVRTPTAVTSVRGTDFVFEGKANGDMVVSVLSGGIDIRPLKGGKPLKLDAGQSGLIPKSGKPYRLPPKNVSSMAKDWQMKSGIKDQR
jgi:hypothetical protein